MCSLVINDIYICQVTTVVLAAVTSSLQIMMKIKNRSVDIALVIYLFLVNMFNVFKSFDKLL